MNFNESMKLKVFAAFNLKLLQFLLRKIRKFLIYFDCAVQENLKRRNF
jgi:hypothetical protein